MALPLIDKFLRGFREADDGEVGILFRKEDGSIWYRKPDGSEAEVGGGGSMPEGAVAVFPFADAESADDALGSNGDLALLLDTGTFIQKAGGTWATS